MTIVNQVDNALFDNACEGRLTLVSGVPISPSGIRNTVELYFCPYNGDHIALYTDGMWRLYEFTEATIAIPATPNTVYDVFGFDNGDGLLSIERLAWTNDSTRATALAFQNGVYVKSGDPSRRYIGSFNVDAGSGVESSETVRGVWNYYNRVKLPMSVVEPASSWTYTTANTYRQVNANTANQFDILIGVQEDCIEARAVNLGNSGSSGNIYTGIGINSTTVNSATVNETAQVVSSLQTNAAAKYTGYPALGRFTLVWLETASITDMTFLGDAGAPTFFQAGMTATILG